MNANGLFVGDEIRILGVGVGAIDKIEPQPTSSKVTFSVDKQYAIPADARAAILSPSLVTSRAIQLVPVVLRRSQIGCRSVNPAEPHRGARRMG